MISMPCRQRGSGDAIQAVATVQAALEGHDVLQESVLVVS